MDGSLSIGQINQDVDVSFGDILSDFDVGGSVFAGVGKGNHAFHFDYTYLRLKPDATALPTPPFPTGSTLSTKITTKIFEPAYEYRFDGPGSTALVFGARYMDIEIKMTPDVALPEPFSGLPISNNNPQVTGPSWWDYFVGIRTQTQISANWDFNFYGTVGGGDSDLPWTVQAIFGRRLSNDNRVGLGARVWNIDYKKNQGIMGMETRLDLTFYGLMIGYEFN
jgi:hypothetical protein